MNRRRIQTLTLVTMCLATFLAILDSTVVNLAELAGAVLAVSTVGQRRAPRAAGACRPPRKRLKSALDYGSLRLLHSSRNQSPDRGRSVSRIA